MKKDYLEGGMGLQLLSMFLDDVENLPFKKILNVGHDRPFGKRPEYIQTKMDAVVE